MINIKKPIRELYHTIFDYLPGLNIRLLIACEQLPDVIADIAELMKKLALAYSYDEKNQINTDLRHLLFQMTAEIIEENSVDLADPARAAAFSAVAHRFYEVITFAGPILSAEFLLTITLELGSYVSGFDEMSLDEVQAASSRVIKRLDFIRG